MSNNESMRKHIAPLTPAQQPNSNWLDVQHLAQVVVTSEDPAAPIESVFHLGQGRGWRAADPGAQSIQLIFDTPQRLQRIWLRFVETASERTQEITLRYSELGHQERKEIVRQQWNFSPAGSTSETEDYRVDLPRVSVLELWIEPDQRKGVAFAGLDQWRLA